MLEVANKHVILLKKVNSYINFSNRTDSEVSAS